MATHAQARPLFDSAILGQAVIDSFRKLTPQRQVRNPVMFVVYVGSILTTLLFFQALVGKGEAPSWFILVVTVWLWFTVLFANFAEAMAEGRGQGASCVAPQGAAGCPGKAPVRAASRGRLHRRPQRRP